MEEENDRDTALTLGICPSREFGKRGDGDEESGSRKKLKLTKEQSAFLEERFKEQSTLGSMAQKQALAKQLNLQPRQVEVWFQNRRARTKLKKTEVDRELLRKCFERLRKENGRLLKELQQLKTQYSTSPHEFPVVMCPSCERMVGAAAAGDNATTAGRKFYLDSKRSHLLDGPCTHSAAC
ncbi:hypothetical protein HPP92_007715 [Vanilla planifolia]|uniref:Homeobox domain-containing protein n=1 Tax=Vanilla planifolia TaxID=51239 RepID=A0A835V659_VANPL|nr:hypothetical protein HPP92_007715 [Vanilla planifolia]